MRVGIFAGDATGPKPLSELVDGALQAEQDGFASYWLPWIVAHDPMVALALAGARTTRIELGTAVMRTYTRNPADLAPSAVTVAVATGGRFVLGVGPSHRPLIEDMFGYSFDHPVAHTEEYLSVLTRLLADHKVDHDGRDFHVHFATYHPDPVPVPVILAALGPKMLRVAGRLADGTFTWMTGPVTLASHTVPTITAAAAAAGRGAPRVIVGAPVLVTDDVDAGYELATTVFSGYGQMPSYQAMLAREGWDGPVRAAIVGDEDHVTTELERFRHAGATDFAAVEFDFTAERRQRTRSLLAAVATR